MSAFEIISTLTTYFNELFEQKVKEAKYRPDMAVLSNTDFERLQMTVLEYNGDKPLSHGTFREYLSWSQQVLDAKLGLLEENAISRIKYLTATPVNTLYDGEVPAVVQNLVLSGVGVLPTINANPDLMPSDLLFNFSSDIVKGQLAYNEDDDLWFYRKKNNTLGKLVSKSLYDTDFGLIWSAHNTTASGLSGAISDYNAKIELSAQGLRVEFDEAVFELDEDDNKVIKETYSSRIVNTAREFTTTLEQSIFDESGDLTTSFNSKVEQTAQAITTALEETLIGEEGVIQLKMNEAVQTAEGNVTTLKNIMFGEGNDPDSIDSMSEAKAREIADLLSESLTTKIYGSAISLANIPGIEGQPITLQLSETKDLVDIHETALYDIVLDGEGNVTSKTSRITQLSDRIDLTVSQEDYNTKTEELETSLSGVVLLSNSATLFSKRFTKPPYDAATTYSADDEVIHSDHLYKALQSVPIDKLPSSNPTYWEDLGATEAVNGASIIAMINSDGSSGVKISADKINIDGEAIFQAAGYKNRQVFTSRPVYPYTKGDLWFTGTSTKVCTETRETLDDFVNNDEDVDELDYHVDFHFAKKDNYDSTITAINGGLITSGTIKLGVNGIESAGITGYQSSDAEIKDVRIWAGSTYANRGTAPFRVYEDGKMVCTIAEITGAIDNENFTVTETGAVSMSFTTAGGVKYRLLETSLYSNTVYLGDAAATDSFLQCYSQAIFSKGVTIDNGGSLIVTGGVNLSGALVIQIGTSVPSGSGKLYKDTNGFVKITA